MYASCHFDGLSIIEIVVEYYVIFGMFSFTVQNWENNFSWPIISSFFQFRGDEKNHNKFSMPILKFDDPTKWHDAHIK